MPGTRRVAAALCLLLAVSAGADEGAYMTLVSMGRAAATDRGIDAGAPPTDAPRRDRSAVFSGAVVDAASNAAAQAAAAPTPAAAGAYAAPAVPLEADVLAAENGAPGRRRWLRAAASLAPARRRAAEFSAPDVSSATARALLAPPAADAAARAGARRGLDELLSIGAAPLAP